MKCVQWVCGLLFTTVLFQDAALAETPPQLERRGEAIQLIVDGAPYLILGGELHNSSASSPMYMTPIWDQLARNGLRTVIGSASWELVEAEEGQFDFSAVDDQIKQARARKMRLVMIWFGAYKNAESRYAPSWVRRDEARFPRGVRDPDYKAQGVAAYLKGPILSVFSEALVKADARAFAALMRHIRQVDVDRTVIMVQVENEVGVLGSPRDHSPLANAAWKELVPEALMTYLNDQRDSLQPEVKEAWVRQGFRRRGSWAEVFGTDAAAGEIFMAWAFGSYVEQVARAGAAEYALPMYANAWLGPQPRSPNPGDYPSGGPVARMMDIWKAAAPSLALLAPDIYVDNFAETLSDFKRSENPIFIPEARADAGNLFVALGQYAAIGFSPFGIEDVSKDNEVYEAYGLLNEMTGLITSAQADGRIRGIKIDPGETKSESLGGYKIDIFGPRSTVGVFGAGTGKAEEPDTGGYGLIINTADDAFLAVGQGISLKFSAADADVEVDSVQEGVFADGQWVPGRTLNGDERYQLFPNKSLGIVRITLFRR